MKRRIFKSMIKIYFLSPMLRQHKIIYLKRKVRLKYTTRVDSLKEKAKEKKKTFIFCDLNSSYKIFDTE